MKRSVDAAVEVRASVDLVTDILRGHVGRVLSDPEFRGDLAVGAARTSLAAPMRSGAHVTQEVLIEFGPVETGDGEVSMPLRWTPTGNERVLPSFEGALVVTSRKAKKTQLTISGEYDVPLGVFGRFGEAVMGRRVARESVEALVEQMAHRIDAEADRRRESISFRPAPYNVDLREYTKRGHLDR